MKQTNEKKMMEPTKKSIEPVMTKKAEPKTHVFSLEGNTDQAEQDTLNGLQQSLQKTYQKKIEL